MVLHPAFFHLTTYKENYMKKIAAILALLIFAAGAVFAEDAPSHPFTITVDAALDAFYARFLLDDYKGTNETTGSPFRGQGDDTFKMFQTSQFDTGLVARARFAYTHEQLFGGVLQLRPDSATLLGDWNAWLRFGSLVRVLVGNTAQRGQISEFGNFDDFLKSKHDNLGIMMPVWKANDLVTEGNNFDTAKDFPFGYDAPGANQGFVMFNGSNSNDIFMPAGATSRNPVGILLDLSVAPVTVSASLGGLLNIDPRPFYTWWKVGGERDQDYDSGHAPVENKGFNIAGRVEAAKIAEMITFALVYKHASYSLTKTDAKNVPGDKGTDNLLDVRVMDSAFGAYATINPLPKLGITVGYSGQFRTWVNELYMYTDIPTQYIQNDVNLKYILDFDGHREVILPFYNGVDLRFNYTGLEFLGQSIGLTLNNNVTFSSMAGRQKSGDKSQAAVFGWAYKGKVYDDVAAAEDRREDYLGLTNTLGIKLDFGKGFIGDFQVSNQLALFTLNWENDPLRAITNSSGFYTGVNYTLYKKGNISASIRGGLALRWNSFSFQEYLAGDDSYPIYRAGYLDLGVPLGVKVEF
jgi:hypothetical protein